jgi:hypothetical protein
MKMTPQRTQLLRDALLQCAGTDVPFDRADALVRVPMPEQARIRFRMFDEPINGLIQEGVLVEVMSPTAGWLWVSARGLERSEGRVPRLHSWGDAPGGGQVKG